MESDHALVRDRSESIHRQHFSTAVRRDLTNNAKGYFFRFHHMDQILHQHPAVMQPEKRDIVLVFMLYLGGNN